LVRDSASGQQAFHSPERPAFSQKLILDFAVAGPIPGASGNCSTEAELGFSEFAGGFFWEREQHR
jgi:hypothetical protein